MTNPELRKHLASRYACKEAMEWLGDRDSQQMWAECPRPDWLLWYVNPHVSRQELVLAVCDCAETALINVPAGEDRPRLAIETARSWAIGEADMGSVKKAASEAYAASYGVTLAAHAAGAAYAAARTAYASANASRSLADAVTTAACAPDDTDSYFAPVSKSARAANAKMCRLIRQRWPVCPEAK